LGWASLQLGEPELSLAPWQLLASRNPSDLAVLEAKLAIPYNLALLKAERQSLKSYQDAINSYHQASKDIEQIINQVTQGPFPDDLIEAEAISERKEPKGAYNILLLYLLSGNLFQERLQDYKDLCQLEQNLQQWQEKIDTYQTMLATQQLAYQQHLPQVKSYLKGTQLQVLTRQRDQLKRLYQKAASPEEPPFILATGEEKKHLERLKRIDHLIKTSGAQEQLRVQKMSADLLKGVLIWQTVTEHPARRWNLQKEMHSLEQHLKTAQKQEAALVSAQQKAKTRFSRFAIEIKQLKNKIPVLLNQVTQLRNAQGKQLQKMALKRLKQRKMLINDYLIQARFGIANLLDISSGKEESPQ
jgi:hypothetical protein